MSGEQSVLHVNGVDVNVVDVGEGGPALVFLHFWGGSSRTWGPVIENLSRVARCIAIDFRGWGRSNKDATDHELETLADDVIGVVDALRLEEFTIVGHSMGGKVAQLVAARRPEGLKQLILIAPAPPTSLGVPKEQRQGMLASYQAREGAEQVVGILAARPLSQAHREQVVEDILSGSPDAKRAWPEKGMTQDISAEASRITVRCMLLSAVLITSRPRLRSGLRLGRWFRAPSSPCSPALAICPHSKCPPKWSRRSAPRRSNDPHAIRTDQEGRVANFWC